jgi:hypothetical protein
MRTKFSSGNQKEMYQFEYLCDELLKTNGNYKYQLFEQSVTLHFVFMGFIWLSLETGHFYLKNINQFIFVMVK